MSDRVPVIWKRGYVSGEDVGRKSRRIDGMVPTNDLHVFEFVQAPSLREGIGTLEPLCRSRSKFFIMADIDRQLMRDPNRPHCADCEAALADRGDPEATDV